MELLIVFPLTFCLILAFAWLMNWCRRRKNRTHSCHDSAESACPSCRKAFAQENPGTQPPKLQPLDAIRRL